MKFFSQPNLASTTLTESEPWDFFPPETQLRAWRQMPKPARRSRMKTPSTQWDVYTAVRGANPAQIVGTDNPASGVRGFVADYDVVQSIDSVTQLIDQIPAHFRPTFIEKSLSQKIRLIWVFAEELPVPDSAYVTRLWRELAHRGNWATCLAGFDAASYKPAERWTNGAEWYEVGQPLEMSVVVGCAIEAGKAMNTARGLVPLDRVAEEVQKQFPGRWVGEFKLDALGVRFWDPAADAPAGAQVKPDGMLCFTGKVGFMSWAEIFGRAWVDTESAINLSSAIDGMFFDGVNYWMMADGRWSRFTRQDILLQIELRGLSATKAKGQNVSDAMAALGFLQLQSRVLGAAPLINYPPGLVKLEGGKYLNTAVIRPTVPLDHPASSADFPWLWRFLSGIFTEPDPENPRALHTFLAWLKRGYVSVREHRADMGQIVFLCGPKSAGKTLLVVRIIAPLLGGGYRNPYDYMVGTTQFTDELFQCFLWAINDEEAPKGDAQRQKFLARLKSFAVNPEHTFHPKFCDKLVLKRIGRMCVTHNDDPGAAAILPEVNDNTRDKMSFYRCQPFAGVFPPNDALEKVIADELPAFARFLLDWEAPDDVLEDTRMGVQSYYDPHVLAMSRHMHASHNLSELIAMWQRVGSFWTEEPQHPVWEGTATSLISEMSLCDSLRRLVDEWTVGSLAKRLTDLTRDPTSGVTYVEGSDRIFRVTRHNPS